MVGGMGHHVFPTKNVWMVHSKKTADVCCHRSLKENFVRGIRGDPLLDSSVAMSGRKRFLSLFYPCLCMLCSWRAKWRVLADDDLLCKIGTL